MIPQRRPGQSFEQHQFEVAVWAGYETAAQLNRDHDPLHRAMCAWLGVPSNAMLDAAGVTLGAEQRETAALEEVAVLHLQRFIRSTGAAVPTLPNERNLK